MPTPNRDYTAASQWRSTVDHEHRHNSPNTAVQRQKVERHGYGNAAPRPKNAELRHPRHTGALEKPIFVDNTQPNQGQLPSLLPTRRWRRAGEGMFLRQQETRPHEMAVHRTYERLVYTVNRNTDKQQRGCKLKKTRYTQRLQPVSEHREQEKLSARSPQSDGGASRCRADDPRRLQPTP